MNELQLVKPSIEMKRLALYFKNELFDHCVTVINGGLKFDNIENYEGWLHIVHSSFSPETVNPKWGVTHTFFAVRAEDQKIVGIINLRLFLTEKFANSGHIGYSVRPSERQKGYAGLMLKQILDYAKSLKMSEVEIVTKSDNIASIQTIRHACTRYQQISRQGKEIFKLTI